MFIRGVVRKDRVTKNLTKRLKQGDIALIAHKDLDEIAATSLVERKVKGIINIEETISGKYPNKGHMILEEAGIPIFECFNNDIFDTIKEGQRIEIENGKLFYKDKILGECNLLDKEKIEVLLNKGYENIEKELDKFIEN